MAAQSSVCDFGWKAVDFSLPGTDGRMWTLADVRGANGTLIMFICNHCPYVKAVIDQSSAIAVNWSATASNPSPSCRTTPSDTRTTTSTT